LKKYAFSLLEMHLENEAVGEKAKKGEFSGYKWKKLCKKY